MPRSMPVNSALPSFKADSRPIMRVNSASNAAHDTMHRRMTISARQPKKYTDAKAAGVKAPMTLNMIFLTLSRSW